MEQLTPDVYCQRATLELIALIRHQRRPRTRVRHDSPLLRHCIREVLAATPAAPFRQGPWRVVEHRLRRPGRGGLPFIPMVQRGKTKIMLSTPQEAEELVAFLNYCGLDEFGPR